MRYNEIYELVKPIYQWLEEHYPHDKYIKIERNGFSLCEDRTMGINQKEFDKTKAWMRGQINESN